MSSLWEIWHSYDLSAIPLRWVRPPILWSVLEHAPMLIDAQSKEVIVSTIIPAYVCAKFPIFCVEMVPGMRLFFYSKLFWCKVPDTQCRDGPGDAIIFCAQTIFVQSSRYSVSRWSWRYKYRFVPSCFCAEFPVSNPYPKMRSSNEWNYFVYTCKPHAYFCDV